MFSAATGAWMVLPIIALSLLLFFSMTLRVAEAVETWVPAEATTGTSSTSVQVALTWNAPPTPLAPAWQGTVQKVYAEVGAIVKSGDPVVRINGIDRIAFAGNSPFWRPIAPGMRGDDVASLNDLLALLDFAYSDSDTATLETVAGVRQLALHIGAPGESSFQPDWVIYMSADELTAESIEAIVSGPAPTPGAPVLTPAASLTEARLAMPGSLRDPVPSTAKEPAAGDASFVPKQGPSDVGQAFTVPDDGQVLSGGTVLPIDDSRQMIAAEGLVTLRSQLEKNARSTTVMVEVPTPSNSVIVPAAVVKSTAAGGHCVVIRSQERYPQKVIEVKVLSESMGRVVIQGDVPPGSSLLASRAEQQICG